MICVKRNKKMSDVKSLIFYAQTQSFAMAEKEGLCKIQILSTF